jgi:hypothetical protein
MSADEIRNRIKTVENAMTNAGQPDALYAIVDVLKALAEAIDTLQLRES